MKQTTLCYIEKNESYLMMHRVKKENDINQDKWVGVGGKLEEGESPEDCLLREVREETGLVLKQFQYRGFITFISNKWGTEYMHLFTATEYEGEIKECEEGNLEWVEKSKIEELHLWEGDKIFFRLLDENAGFFTLKLCYQDDNLVSHEIYRY
ncbi:MAG: 8-oxo-dGTP diphosphatase [Lachnospiraceae bacterium]|nr:8-oxo-dGTP diphosphatase [Lachnospiraceae bacterium]